MYKLIGDVGTVLTVSATVTNLQQKLEGLQTANTLMKEDIRIAKSNIVQLQQENLNLRRDKETLLDEHHRQMQVGCISGFFFCNTPHCSGLWRCCFGQQEWRMARDNLLHTSKQFSFGKPNLLRSDLENLGSWTETESSIWATICKTVRAMLSYRCLSCPVLSVTLVYCGQKVEWIKMKLGMQVGLGPGHTVLNGDPTPPSLKGHSPPTFGLYLLWQYCVWCGPSSTPLPTTGQSPQFSAHVCCGQMAGLIKMPLGTKVGLGPGDSVLHGDPASLHKGHSPIFFDPCLFWRNGRPSHLLLSTCWNRPSETWVKVQQEWWCGIGSILLLKRKLPKFTGSVILVAFESSKFGTLLANLWQVPIPFMSFVVEKKMVFNAVWQCYHGYDSLSSVESLHCFCLQTAQDDIDTERAAYQMSRAGLDTMYQESQQRLQHEITCRTVSNVHDIFSSFCPKHLWQLNRWERVEEQNRLIFVNKGQSN